MFQELLIAFAQVKVGKTFENLANKICQLMYYLYWAKKGTYITI